MRRTRRQIDWFKCLVWGGTVALTIALWTLAAIGLASLLGGHHG